MGHVGGNIDEIARAGFTAEFQWGSPSHPGPAVNDVKCRAIAQFLCVPSRQKGQVYLTVVYALERRILLWVGDDRTEEAVKPFFTREMGARRCHTLRVICMDMWAASSPLLTAAPQAVGTRSLY